MAVSRRHFEIQKRDDGKWEAADLGSKNGVDCFRQEGGSKSVNLKEALEPWILKDGDMLLIGGGPGTEGRLIGFRFYEKGGESFLIKFNATSVDELATAGGLYNQRPELIGKIRGESVTTEVQQEVKSKGSELVSMFDEMSRLQSGDNQKQFLEAGMSLQSKILEVARDMGSRFYQGDWAMALSEIGSWAFKEGNSIIKNKDGEDLTESDAKKAMPYLKVASQLMELSSNYRYSGH